MSTPLIVPLNAQGQRLDVFCTIALPGYSRASLQKAIKEGHILVGGKQELPRYIVRVGDVVSYELDAPQSQGPAEKAELNIPIVHEDKDVVVINKPAGIAVHHGVGISQATVLDWFLQRYPEQSRALSAVSDRGGIVHRLDKDTSGIMILAKTEAAFIHLKKQFQDRRPKKEYLALVFGVPGGKDGRITRPIARSRHNPMRRAVDEGGKESATQWAMEEKFGTSYALLRVFPFTGRMHQIRVHLHYLGYPIVGDQLYTFKRKKQPAGARRHMLHAEKLAIMLPGGKLKTFVAPLPEDFQGLVDRLRDGKL